MDGKDDPAAAVRASLSGFAPKLIDYTDEVLFGDLWRRPQLSKRDRSLVTIAMLTALYRVNELPFHLKLGRENGLSQEEIVETLTHAAFYAGWPAAMSAVNIAKSVLDPQPAPDHPNV
ncbi:carboxymuconolactone decarboxylase family protein [Zavarzinia compransoris]|uniref:Carboxymuconolactone decarboxylase family protein n=1 Tax=Zavarzinia compransoris TaxID=1264899 RepID=A0A317E941_9PROT|nr:carboxymuconolactone decarboxylase family protein [Zavarzinia compransoris]PWR21625.1 carboxymuconolactone decarboxylase family protein [Zavarzinia compransoris]TDP45595.1 4-carboxymuconolactone decarboxylase [Zavarzinia compransoris]